MSSFRPNPAFEREQRKEPAMVAEMERQAGEVRDKAIALAPKKTGYYARRIKVLPDPDGDGWLVASLDEFGHLVEYGSSPHWIGKGKKRKKVGGNPAYAPLRRGVKAAGLRFRPSPKPLTSFAEAFLAGPSAGA